MRFQMGEEFSLGDLMRLGLHQNVDACSEIVDRARKELTIENGLKKIEDTWGSLSLSFTTYQVTWPIFSFILYPSCLYTPTGCVV